MKQKKYNRNHFNRKYKVNHDFFKKWSRDMAYILGFWFTDGCITNNKFVITQHKNEKCLLKKILRSMGANYPLAPNNDSCFFAISSQTILDDIRKLGGTERKSLVAKFPHVPKKYLPDFIRGLWDGDGCIDKKRYSATFVSGSKSFVRKLHNILEINIPNLKGKIRIQIVKRGTILSNKRVKKTDSTYYYLVFRANNARRLRDFMYKNECNIMMKRKYEIFNKAGPVRTDDRFHKIFISLKEAKKFIKILGIKNEMELRSYRRKNKLDNIPYSPDITYKNKGWKGWGNFFKKEFYSYEKTKTVLKNRKIRNYSDWENYVKNGKSCYIPYNPKLFYKNNGWISWKDFLGIKI